MEVADWQTHIRDAIVAARAIDVPLGSDPVRAKIGWKQIGLFRRIAISPLKPLAESGACHSDQRVRN